MLVAALARADTYKWVDERGVTTYSNTPPAAKAQVVGARISVYTSGPALKKAGGRFIVRGMPMKTYEQGVRERTVIVEFDSVHKAVAAHDSAPYQEALKALGDGAERDMRIVEGVG